MSFSNRQTRALCRAVPARYVRSRVREGKALSYVEGWYVLAQANRIFGFDGWDRETVETKCIMGRDARGTSTAVYSARVRITVHVDGRVIVRDGHGTGEATGQSVGEVHDRALKAAETDATKRALATFGKAFGLALYAPTQPIRSKHGDASERTVPPPVADISIAQPAAEETAGIETTRERGGTANGAAASKPDRANGSPPLVEGRIDKSALVLDEPRRVRDKDHLRYVAGQPCLICSASPSDAHHVRFAQPRAMGRKVGDDFTVPLCRAHHGELHQYGNEFAWWHDMGLDPIEIAGQLWAESRSRQSS